MAELVDALVSGTSNSNVVQVRFLFWAREAMGSSLICPGGGIGRHASLRGWCLLQGVQVQILFWAPQLAQRAFPKREMRAALLYSCSVLTDG